MEIINTLDQKNKNKDIVEFDKFYVFDENKVIISKNKIIKNKKKGKNKKLKNISKIPIKILTRCIGEDEFVIYVKKTVNNYRIGMVFEIAMDL